MKEEILNIKGAIKYNELLLKHTTFRIGGPAEVFVTPHDENDLKKILSFARSKGIKTFVIGRGSNLLVRDKGFDGIIIRIIEPYFCNMRIDGTTLKAGAGVSLSKLVVFACQNSLGGLEGLVGIPGTVGGALVMNAGYESMIGDRVKKVRAIDKEGKLKTLSSKNLKFGYRKSNLFEYIITEVEFQLKRIPKTNLIKICGQLMKLKKKTQPLDMHSAGCVFKNPQGEQFSAGEIIDFCGLKGKKVGDAEISRRHANFIVNTKSARSKDVMDLIKLVRETVKKRSGIALEQEIIVL